jgi:hypothetical protein
MNTDSLLKLAQKYFDTTSSGGKLRNALNSVDYTAALNEALNMPNAYGVTYISGDKYGADIIVKPGMNAIDYNVYGTNVNQGEEQRFQKGAQIFRQAFIKNLSRQHLQALQNAQLSDEERQKLVAEGDQFRWLDNMVIP